jgi:hypothetical protein
MQLFLLYDNTVHVCTDSEGGGTARVKGCDVTHLYCHHSIVVIALRTRPLPSKDIMEDTDLMCCTNYILSMSKQNKGKNTAVPVHTMKPYGMVEAELHAF